MAKKAMAGPTFTRDILEELKKVTWPKKQETIKLTIVVIIISLIIAFYIGIIDFLLTKVLAAITKFR